jgi:transposase
MVDWLQAKGVTHVAMESTGVYWKPIYNLLEETGIQPLVVNARDMKNVPGRKTDVKDAEWIANLLRHGLLRGSFIPSRAQRELRELVRYRRSLIEEQSREVNRIQKVLEGANIKLGDVAADVLGKSGREILECLVQVCELQSHHSGIETRTVAFFWPQEKLARAFTESRSFTERKEGE